MKEVYIASENPVPDDYVRFVQIQLNRIRMSLIHTLPSVKENGKYDKETADAIRVFQQVCNIRVDGMLGPQTRNCLGQKLLELQRMQTSLPITNKSTSSSSMMDKLEFLAKEIAAPIADCLSNASLFAAKELKKLNSSEFTSQDIQRLQRMLFDRSDVKNLREVIKNKLYNYYEGIARGNTNILNYKNDPRTLSRIKDINSARGLLTKGYKGLNSKGMALVDKQVVEQLLNKIKSELKSVDFGKKLTIQISTKAKGGIRISGGGILTAITLIPFVWHLIMFCYYKASGQPTEDIEKKLYEDIISLIEGALIAFVVAGIVGAFVTGGTAVVVTIVICLLLGLLLSLFFPEHEKKIADNIYEWIHGSSPSYYQLQLQAMGKQPLMA